MKLHHSDDIDPKAIADGPIAIIGFGSQGKAHARNLRDSGYEVILGLREGGPTWNLAKEEGFTVMSPAAAAEKGKLISILTPDMAQEALYREHIAKGLKPGDALMFAHGFSVHFGRIQPPKDVDVMLVAPKSPGDLVRREYENGRGVPCLAGVYNDATGKAMARALAYAGGLGGAHAGILETTFAEETETDLFGEQAVLCGGVSELILKGFETLTEAGYQPEVAYFECLHELKLIVDLLQEGGLAKMHAFISETAKYGDFVSGPRVVDDSSKEKMKAVLKDIQDGTFARNWILENQAGLPQYKAMERADLNHPIEKVGKDLRARMAWLNAKHNQ